MRKAITGPLGRVLTIMLVIGAAFAFYLYLMSGTAARVPFVQPEGYITTATFKDVDNLVPASLVRVAGVTVGDVRKTEQVEDGVKVTIGIDNEDVVPLHEGAKIRVGERSLVGEAYLDITDGDGPPLKEYTHFPDDAVQESTQVDDVLASLDDDSRESLGSAVRSLGQGTEGRREDIAASVAGLGNLGREGHTALDAIAAQSEDLRALANETTTLLDALDTGEGQIAGMVTNVDRITNATSGQRESVENTMRQLPGVLDSARSGADSLNDVSRALAPVASNLNEAAPPLNEALNELPATTKDLRETLPPLSRVLDDAPATLDRVPAFDQAVHDAVPPVQGALRDVNPMLSYIRPYGPELASFFANFNSALQYKDEAGRHYIRLTPVINEKSPQVPLTLDALGTYNNPIPPPGQGATPGPVEHDYPRVEREPR